MTHFLDGVPESLPALVRALRISELAAAKGFEWEHIADINAKVHEELTELDEALNLAGGRTTASVTEEFGDVLLALVNLARHLDIDAEAALKAASDKFISRFRVMAILAGEQGRALEGLTGPEWGELWRLAKARAAAV